MKKMFLSAAVLGVVCLSSTSVWADSRDERIRLLEAQVKMLAQEIQTLKDESAAQKAETRQLADQVENTPVRVQHAENTETPKKSVDISMDPTPKFTYGEFEFQPAGRMHIDYAAFHDDVADHPNGAEFRRIRLGAQGKVSSDLEYKIDVDFAGSEVNVKDAYINYVGLKNTDIRLGQFKPGFSFEDLASSNDLTFIERAAATSAFGVGQILGVGAYRYDDHWTVSAGLFNDHDGTQSTDDEAWYASVRGTAAPINSENALLHFGASAGYRRPDQAGHSFDFDATAENGLQAKDSVAATFGGAQSAQLYGFETAAVYGPLSAQAEYYLMHVNRDRTNRNLRFDGGYAQLAWTLTGERRPYKIKPAAMGGIAPYAPFDLSTGDWGAFELAARYSMLDVTDENVLGGEMSNYTFGLNWYLNKNARLMANYIHVNTDDNAVTADDDPQILLLRGQIKW